MICLLLVGCGGGSTASQTVSGVAAAGAPLQGTVYLKDSSNPTNELSTSIASDGSFVFYVGGLTPPFLLKAVGTSNGNVCELYSFAADTGVANINPLSKLTVVMANNGDDLAALYANMDPVKIQGIKGGLPHAQAQLQTILQPTLSQFDSSSVNFISGNFAANHQGLDLMFDLIGISVVNGTVTVSDKSANTALTYSLREFPSKTISIPAPGQSRESGSVIMMPRTRTIYPNETVNFSALVIGAPNQEVAWSIVEAHGGTITAKGVYTAPVTTGTYHVVATSLANPLQKAEATIRVLPKNIINLWSDPGDYVGQGNNYSYTNKNSRITIYSEGRGLYIGIDGDEHWTGGFLVPDNVNQLQPGVYTNANLYPTYKPGLNWSGEGRSNTNPTGWFAIDSVTYDNNVLSAIDLRFEQHEIGGGPALHGQVHWSTLDTIPPPGPINPPPAGLWQPAPGATPAVGNYVYLKIDPGDSVGDGKSYTYTQANAQITIDSPAGAPAGFFTISVEGIEFWYGRFLTMYSLNRLQPGYYSIQLNQTYNPARGLLDWIGEGRGCSTTSWFIVDNVTYDNDIVTAIDLRFEQHCEGLTQALHGKIHWVQ